MRDEYEEFCDNIDAGFFTGDAFHSKEACDRLEMYMERWQRQIADIRNANYYEEVDEDN